METAQGNLPKRTKFAVWWIFTLGIVGTIAAIITMCLWPYPDPNFILIQIPIAIAIGFLYILPAIFLTRRKRWSWTAAVVMLASGTIGLTGLLIYLVVYSVVYYSYPWYEFIPAVIVYLVPLWFISHDKRNYWIMLSHISAKVRRKTAAVTSGKSQ